MSICIIKYICSHWSRVTFYDLSEVFGDLSSPVSFRNLGVLQIHGLLPHILIQQNSPVMGTFNTDANTQVRVQ